MTVTLKENENPENMLEEPKDISEEMPREGENEAATTGRNLRDKLARDRVMKENEERRTRGPRVGHNVFHNEVQKKLVSTLLLSLSLSGQKERKGFYSKIHTPNFPKRRSRNLQS